MILVIGSTGNVGSELVPQLVEAGQRVRILVRDPRKAAHFDPRVERVTGDLGAPETLPAAMAGVERLFFLAYSSQQQANALEAAKRAGVRHVVKLSTLEASHTPPLGTGKPHHVWDAEVRASGLEWTIVQPGMFMSNAVMWFAGQIKQKGVAHFPGGEGKAAPIDPHDIAAVAAAALTGKGHEGQNYGLTGPELLSMGDMVRILSEAIGKPLKYVDIPESAAAEQMRQRGMPAEAVENVIETLHGVRTNRLAYRTDTVERVLGRAPRTFETWCRKHVAAFQ